MKEEARTLFVYKMSVGYVTLLLLSEELVMRRITNSEVLMSIFRLGREYHSGLLILNENQWISFLILTQKA